MTFRLVRVPAAALLAAAVLACCQTPVQGTGGDYGVHAIQFQDVVVPAAFRLQADQNQSYSLEASGYRQAHFEYSGSTPLAEATAYVLDRMPQHSWEVVADEQPTSESRHLRFQRGRYAADYRFERHEGVTRMVVDYRTVTPER